MDLLSSPSPETVCAETVFPQTSTAGAIGVSETFSLDNSTSTSSYHPVAKKVRTGDPVASVVGAVVPTITVTVDGGSTYVVSSIVGSSKKSSWQSTLRMTMTMTIPLYPPLGSTSLETRRNKIMYSFFYDYRLQRLQPSMHRVGSVDSVAQCCKVSQQYIRSIIKEQVVKHITLYL